jgi:hypothetical protein
LGFVALGLRISRLLRFCDLAISACPSFVFPGGQGRGSGCQSRGGRFLDNVLARVRPVRIRVRGQDTLEHAQLAPMLFRFDWISFCGMPHQGDLFILEYFVYGHCTYSLIGRRCNSPPVNGV